MNPPSGRESGRKVSVTTNVEPGGAIEREPPRVRSQSGAWGRPEAEAWEEADRRTEEETDKEALEVEDEEEEGVSSERSAARTSA